MKQFITYYQSPIGWLEVVTIEDALLEIRFVDSPQEHRSNEYAGVVLKQLDEYFHGDRTVFDLNLVFEGTEFQKKCWKVLLKIPYGDKISYKQQAIIIDNPKATRAVGNANGKNPMAIVVPCHRVIASNNKIGGYSSGVSKKEWLLNHETAFKNT